MSKRNVLITAGSTMSMIDQVRAVTNIFKGRTGAYIAEYFAGQGDFVTLLTSDPSWVSDTANIRIIKFRTYEDLARHMEEEITIGRYDVMIHSAAVSDYTVSKVYGTAFIEDIDDFETYEEIGNGKIPSSEYDALSLKMVRAPKLIDKIRKPWGFSGVLVKFKLEVGLTDNELIQIARASRQTSGADLIVANLLSTAANYAYILGASDQTQMASRRHLPEQLFNTIADQPGA